MVSFTVVSIIIIPAMPLHIPFKTDNFITSKQPRKMKAPVTTPSELTAIHPSLRSVVGQSRTVELGPLFSNIGRSDDTNSHEIGLGCVLVATHSPALSRSLAGRGGDEAV